MSLADEMQAMIKQHGSAAVLSMLAVACENLAMIAPDVAVESTAFNASTMLVEAAKLVQVIEDRCDATIADGIAMSEEVARDLATNDGR